MPPRPAARPWQVEDRAVAAEPVAQARRRRVARGSRPAGDGHRRRRAGRLAHRHALGHRPDRGVGVVGRAEAAPGDEHVGRVADDERPIGDADRLAVGQVLPGRVRAAVVVLDRGAAQADLRRRTRGPPGRRRGSAGRRRTRAGSRGRRSACRARRATRARSRAPGPRRNRTYSSAWRRPAISASVRNHGSVALTSRPSASRRTESSRVMTVAVTPSIGVMWSEPSRRGRS